MNGNVAVTVSDNSSTKENNVVGDIYSGLSILGSSPEPNVGTSVANGTVSNETINRQENSNNFISGTNQNIDKLESNGLKMSGVPSNSSDNSGSNGVPTSDSGVPLVSILG